MYVAILYYIYSILLYSTLLYSNLLYYNTISLETQGIAWVWNRSAFPAPLRTVMRMESECRAADSTVSTTNADSRNNTGVRKRHRLRTRHTHTPQQNAVLTIVCMSRVRHMCTCVHNYDHIQESPNDVCYETADAKCPNIACYNKGC